MKEPIYLDHNATTLVDPRVVEEVGRTLGEEFGNPSSTHPFGKRSREIIDASRGRVALLLGSRPEEIIFTGGGSESNNLALKGVAFSRGKGHIITCAGEHPAVLEPCAFLQRSGFRVTRLPVDRLGRLDPQLVESAISRDTILISVMHANNETGTIQPISEIGRIARARKILFHTDAAQSTGKILTRIDDLGVDLLSIAGHKLYAPRGVGALYVREGVQLEPLIHGASQERGFRAGTEAVHQIAGLGAACRIALEELEDSEKRMRRLREQLHGLLSSSIDELSLNGHPSERLPNTLNVNFPSVIGAELLGRTSGLAASTGSACHSGETRLSPVLDAMGVPAKVGRGAIRLSLGRRTTEEEIKKAARELVEAHGALLSS